MTPDKQKDGNEGIAILITQLDDPVLDNRHHAVLALAESGEAAVQPLIGALAAAGNDDGRWYRAIALSKTGGLAIIPLI
ncbi:MAG: HEAT repeat domain-containing protein, partial [Methanoregula sp.]